jgi:cell division protease FtsH
MGGRVAEELFLGHLTTGAGNDIEKATDLARRMVCEWGMSDTLGPLTFGKKEEQIFLGREIAQHQDYSEATAVEIDQEVKKLVLASYTKAQEILQGNRDTLLRISDALLEREVLDFDQIEKLVRGEELPPFVLIDGGTPSPVEKPAEGKVKMGPQIIGSATEQPA